MPTRIQLRRGTAAQWTAANPVLGLAEPGVETDTGRRKTGDGVTPWNSLGYDFDDTIASSTFVAKGDLTFDATDYGVVADGSTDDRTAVLAAIAACSAVGGGTVLLPRGVVALSAGLALQSGVTLAGRGRNVTILRRIVDQDASMVGLTSTTYAGVRDLTIDGYWLTDGSLFTTGSHGISAGGAVGTQDALVENVRIMRCKSYGIGLQDAGPYLRNTFRNIHISDTGSDGIDMKNDASLNEDNVFDRITVERFGTASGATERAGIDIRGPAILSNIVVRDVGVHPGVRFRHTSSNGEGGQEASLTGFRVEASGRTAGSKGVQVVSDQAVSISDGTVRGVAIGLNLVGSANAERHTVTGVHAIDCTTGFTISDGAHKTTLIGCTAGTCDTGFRVAGDLTALTACVVEDCTTGVLLDGTAADTLITALRHENVTTLFSGTGVRTRADVVPVTVQTVASAGTIVAPVGAQVVRISGTTNINQINNGYAGRRLTLIFDAALTVGDAVANIYLAGNFVTTVNDVLELMHDGSNWIEVSRSAN